MTARPVFDPQVPHERAVSRSPLGEPSSAAKRFLIEPDPYPAEGYVEPDEPLRAAIALFHARREAELLAAAAEPSITHHRNENDPT